MALARGNLQAKGAEQNDQNLAMSCTECVSSRHRFICRTLRTEYDGIAEHVFAAVECAEQKKGSVYFLHQGGLCGPPVSRSAAQDLVSVGSSRHIAFATIFRTPLSSMSTSILVLL